MKPDWKAALVAAACACFVAPATASSSSVSVEWLTDVSHSIGVYSLDEVDTTKASSRRYRILARRLATLLGEPPDRLALEEIYIRELPDRFPQTGDTLFAFDSPDWYQPLIVSPSHNPGMNPWVNSIDREFRVLKTGRATWELVEKRLADTRFVRGRDGWHDPGLLVMVPDTSEAGLLLGVRRLAYLAVPPDSLELQRLLESVGGKKLRSLDIACALAWCYPQVDVQDIVYEIIPAGTMFEWQQGSQTLSIPVRVIAARAVEEARGTMVSESYYPVPDYPDFCHWAHVTLRRRAGEPRGD